MRKAVTGLSARSWDLGLGLLGEKWGAVGGSEPAGSDGTHRLKARAEKECGVSDDWFSGLHT